MLPFFTQVKILPAKWSTGYNKNHLFLGSCFTENIGGKMAALKFKTDINPFGILYNPFSLTNCLSRLISEKEFTRDELFYYDGLWHSYSHHGRFSDISPEKCLAKINDRLINSSAFLRKTDFLFLTFGTAWVYELKTTGRIVSNCHKVPSTEFKRFSLTIAEIVSFLREILEELWNINPALKVIFTVSPVRHLKDGAVENQLSKATLLLSVDNLIRGFGEERCVYFPAYELMMDELRDYRFYSEDMVHPSAGATDFIWDKFSDWLISEESRNLVKKITGLMAARNHRPVYPDSPGYLDFIRKSFESTVELSSGNPSLDFSEEYEYFRSELTRSAAPDQK